MAIKITFGNFKGGTGKTTNSTMIAYHLAKKGYKTLLVDLDPQANATAMLLLTVQNQRNTVVNFETTLMTAIAENNLKKIVTEINENLFLLPSFADFTSYPLFLEKKFPDSIKERGLYFQKLLFEFEKDYDYIIFDIPPTLSLFTDSALLASDYVVIVLQTHERSFVGAEAFIQYMQELIDNYDVNFDILGILPVLLKNNAIVDKSVLKNAQDTFGESNLFKNIIKSMERLKRYDMTGIIDPEVNKRFDVHDMNVHRLYDKVTAELIERGNNHE
ncbi:AAA family ATPase [Enterococcus faecalis]|uniref:ParA family protein n=1 Tax=Enterococcus faecalis TaxID=1351 RepID=UPI001A0C1615|nr:AAA family ATPase [Enterococcus faecalis]EGO8428647.1 ParA family protein [Enterococcus faecalis]EHZ0460483.1 AAA family ATPase [Enterococcus faecalis]MDN3202235.1 AAA family ATPase [Enterococcus faecalis]